MSAAAAAPAPASPAAVAPAAASSGGDLEHQLSVEHLLAALERQHGSMRRERAEFRRERGELSARLVRLTHELHAEELMGRDLTRRIETLEAALQRERLQHEATLRCAEAAASESGEEPGPLQEPGCEKPKAEPGLDAAALLAAYADQVPRIRAQSCQEVLRTRLAEAGVVLDSLAGREQSPETRGAMLGPERSEHDALADSRVGALMGGEPEGPPLPTWGKCAMLRSHLDAARCVVSDEQGGVLISCGEDALVKGWELGPVWRGAPNVEELEPYATLRGHTAPVLALAYLPTDRILYSGGMDCIIRAWHLPEVRVHNAYGSDLPARQRALRAGAFVGHRDCVWSLQRHPYLGFLASASGDGSIGLWAVDRLNRDKATNMQVSFSIKNPGGPEAGVDLPSCVAWTPGETGRLLGGYSSSRVAAFDVIRGEQVSDFWPAAADGAPDASSGAAGSVTSLSCHGILQLVATGHSDRCARLLDLASGRFVATLDHSAAVSSVCLDPARGHCLVTGSHDGYVRTFDLRNGRCFQRLWLHNRKYEEGVHCVHLAGRLLATAGADGNVAMLLTSE